MTLRRPRGTGETATSRGSARRGLGGEPWEKATGWGRMPARRGFGGKRWEAATGTEGKVDARRFCF
jgi:hypothetical protein